MYWTYSVYKGWRYSDKPFLTLPEAKNYADQRQKRALERGLEDYFVVMEGKQTVYSTKPAEVPAN